MQFSRRKKTLPRVRSKAVVPSMLRRQIIIGVIITIFISLIIFGIYKLTRLDSLQIKNVEVVGGQTIPHANIKKIATDTLNGTYWRLIPRRFTYFFPETEISKNIAALDRVHHVKVDKPDRNKVLVIFDEYVPYALWCDAVESTDCLFIDYTGFAFAAAPDLSGGAFVRFVEAGREPVKETGAFSKEFIASNQSFIELLENELGLFVTQVEKSGDYDLEYTVSGGGQLKVSQTMELDKSFRNLKTVLQSEDFVHLEPGKFQYIDLRFGDKVFVNEEPETAVASTSEAIE